MAGKKIQAQLTPEEELQQALVPEAEQPYKVPANWCWTKLGSISLIKGGKRLPPGKKLNDIKTGYPYIRVTDFDSNSVDVNNIKYIDEETYKILDNYKISINDIYISIAGSIGKVGIIPEILNGAILTENAAKITNIILQNQIYLLYILCSEFCQNQMKESAIATTQSKLALFRIANIKLPLPPLAEQQRIVERIETLFAKLDEAKEKLQNTLDTFETRKAAILHKAFTGELTANWRKQHGLTMDSWEEKKLLDTCMLKSGNTIPSDAELERIENNAIPYLKVSDMNLPNNLIKITTSSKFAFPINIAHLIPFGSTIFPKRGGAILTNKKRFVSVENILVDLNIMAIIPNNKILVNWYCYYWMQLIDLKTLNNGSNIPQINNKDMAKLNIWLPSLIEQTEIVRIIDNLLAKEQQAHSVVQNALAKIDLIKKSILARAFRGQLATNNPADEPAVKLLERVL